MNEDIQLEELNVPEMPYKANFMTTNRAREEVRKKIRELEKLTGENFNDINI